MATCLFEPQYTITPIVDTTTYENPTPTLTPIPTPTVNPCRIVSYRNGAVCRDGWSSGATGSGACSHHGGVSYWTYTSYKVCN